MTETVKSIKPVSIAAYSSISACGLGNKALFQTLTEHKSSLAKLKLFEVPFATFVGEIKGELPEISAELEIYNSRNSRVALAALNHPASGLREAVKTAKTRYGSHRVGVIVGTSTSGLYETESAYSLLLQQGVMPDDFNFVTRHAYQATGRFLQLELGLTGPCFSISTACSSGAKAIAAGQRLIDNDVCDAVLVGGVDTLCRLTLRGFKSLGLVAELPCTPMDKDRKGISIGEAAGLILLEKSSQGDSLPKLLAVGESSDAHHMSTPHPEGKGAVLAMQRALQLARLKAESIGYLNLHATATKINDQVESLAVQQVFSDQLKCSATKGVTGHTLGAAGALEAIIALSALQHQFIPGTYGLSHQDEQCNLQVVKTPQLNQTLDYAMSNSFGFGGNNASIIFSL
ncbi:MAG: beta-ketoacyl-ACP synthase [Methylococcaceae bacterium]